MLTPRIAVILNWRNHTNQVWCISSFRQSQYQHYLTYYRIDTPQNIKPEQWSGTDASWVKPSHPFYFEINNKIAGVWLLCF